MLFQTEDVVAIAVLDDFFLQFFTQIIYVSNVIMRTYALLKPVYFQVKIQK
jgi:hypothetical protein